MIKYGYGLGFGTPSSLRFFEGRGDFFPPGHAVGRKGYKLLGGLYRHVVRGFAMTAAGVESRYGAFVTRVGIKGRWGINRGTGLTSGHHSG